MSLTKAFVLAVLTGGVFVSSGACRAGAPASTGEADPLGPWREGVRVRPVSDRPARHTIHSYYVCNPESPDGRSVLYYASTAADGHTGELCVLDRATGRERVLVRDLNVEDAHRAACQQWLDGGSRVAFHDVRGGSWVVAVVDAGTGRETALVRDRQLGFGRPGGGVLPIYGCHWNPGEHRDLELLDASTGAVRTSLTAGAVLRAHGDWVRREFGAPGISIFFPVLSPDGKRVFLKIARGGGGEEFRSPDASHREGLIGYDLEAGRILFLRERWGHPAWHPDSRRIIEVGNLLIDSDDGSTSSIPDEPRLGGGHPSVSPDGTLFVTDGPLDSLGGRRGEWGVVVGDLRGHRHAIIHRFDNTRGARSWRRSHPHPAFSADGGRIYYNVSDGDWTVLHVAERRDVPAIAGPR